jgi:hypothetical protein
MLAEPALRYHVTLAPSDSPSDTLAESTRLFDDRPDVARDTFSLLRAPGLPVRCSAALEMTADRGVPMRARAAVRSWFDGVQIGSPDIELELTTAALATALLRLPTFDDESWHGFAAETWRSVPVVVSNGVQQAEPSSVRIGTGQDALGRSHEITLSAEDLLRHVHVLGQTGTGNQRCSRRSHREWQSRVTAC